MGLQLDGLIGQVDHSSELREAKHPSDPTMDPSTQALAAIKEVLDSNIKMPPQPKFDLEGGPNTTRRHEDHAHLPQGKTS